MDQIVTFFQEGGIFMIPIAVTLLFAIIISIDRAFKVYYLYGIHSEAFMAQIQNLIINKNIDQAISHCNAKETALLPRVVKAALQEAHQPIERISNRIEEATLSVIPLAESRQAYLPMIANIATLLGLLGTIVGLIEAFASVATIDPSRKAELLTHAISVAMNTTAFGLIVAIPTTVVHTVIQERVAKIMGDIDQYAVKVAHLLSIHPNK